MQNSALGAVLATAHFPAHPLAAVPCAISGAHRWQAGSAMQGLVPPACDRLASASKVVEQPLACPVRRSTLPPTSTPMPPILAPSLPHPAACMHSVMGSMLAAFWRRQPAGGDEGGSEA